MMDEINNAVLEGFAEVWQRVRGQSPAPRRDDAQMLRRLIEQTAEAAAFEQSLARRCAGAARRLRALADETCARLRRLQAAYFLQTGDTLAPGRSCPVAGSVLGDLRRACLSAQERAACARDAAGCTRSEPLAALFADLAEEETMHSEALRALIAAALG